MLTEELIERLPITKGFLSRPQIDFVKSQYAFPALIGGVGSGKTYAGVCRTLGRALLAKTVGYIVAPTYRMLKDATLPKFREIAGDCILEEHKSDMIIVMANGTELLCRSAENPDYLRGPCANFAWLDEAAYMAPYIWPVILGRLREVVETEDGIMLDPTGYVTCTPKGRNWLYDVWVKRHGLDDGYQVLHTITRDNSVNLPETYLNNLERSYAGTYLQQELMGKFVSFEGLVYDMFNEEIHIWNPSQPLPKFIGYEYGMDYGYTNPTAITVHALCEPRFKGDDWDIQVAEIYERHLVPGEVVAKMKALYKEYGRGLVEVDPSSPELIRLLTKAGIDARPADNTVKTGIQKEQAALKLHNGVPRSYITSGCIHTKAEFAAYCWRTKGRDPEGELLDEVQKSDDHLMDARRYRRMGHEGIGRRALPSLLSAGSG